MRTDSELAELMDLHRAKPDRKVRYDSTVNLGHLLTILAIIVAGFASWTTLDKRVVVLEEFKAYRAQTDALKDTAISEKLADIRETVRDLRRGVEDIQKTQLNNQLSGRPKS